MVEKGKKAMLLTIMKSHKHTTSKQGRSKLQSNHNITKIELFPSSIIKMVSVLNFEIKV